MLLQKQIFQQIEDWLLSQGIYNCTIGIDGKLYRLNRSLGIVHATEDDNRLFPRKEAPDWLINLVRQQESTTPTEEELP